MGVRKGNQTNIRNIQKSGRGGSYYVTIPVEIMRELEWKESQKVVVRRAGRKRIVISDWK